MKRYTIEHFEDLVFVCINSTLIGSLVLRKFRFAKSGKKQIGIICEAIKLPFFVASTDHPHVCSEKFKVLWSDEGSDVHYTWHNVKHTDGMLYSVVSESQ